jgi:putative CocE/NonD family hydrolase
VEMHTEVDAEAVMRDGTVLRADVYRPLGEGPWPVLLVRSPYDKQDPDILALLEPLGAVRRGYLVVIQDTRGRFRSEGDWQPLVNEHEDGCDSVRWAARLPGANGLVGMYGPSYLGQAQWAALAAKAPELVSAAPEFTFSDPADGLTARGGARELGLITQWTLTLGSDLLRRRHADRPAELSQRLAALAQAVRELPTRTYWELPSAELPALRRLGLPVPGSPGSPTIQRIGDGLDRLTAPTLVVAGWYDSFIQGSLDNHCGARDTGNPAALIVGPWSHNNQTSRVGEVDFGPAADAAAIDGGGSLRSRELDWLDLRLRPQQPVRATPPVLVFVMGVNEWRRMDRWPPPAADTPWYLRSDGVLSPVPPGPDEPSDRFHHDPTDPVPTWGGPVLLTDDYPPGPLDQRRTEERADVLVYTSEPLPTALEVIGRIRAHVTAASSAPAADWVVRLCDVDVEGVSRNIADGVLRVGGTDPRPTEATEAQEAGPQEHVIDLWSTAHVFQAGHRLRLQVTSSNFPRWDRNPGALAETAEQTVHHDAARPSRIVLPVTRAIGG